MVTVAGSDTRPADLQSSDRSNQAIAITQQNRYRSSCFVSREGGTSPFPAHKGLTKRHHGSERLRIVSSYGDFVSVKSLS
ncbi:hypothetical protein ElyMa_001502100 [Elysia marginata]|uniref:Uncharacterized protein n=1 Tax=Elysia marginata TaxID=1093978 RepID=A0AAV4J4K2_9GAST|nr:hypothetical protein ElyMa_001502100 [Elysia marginata]